MVNPRDKLGNTEEEENACHILLSNDSNRASKHIYGTIRDVNFLLLGEIPLFFGRPSDLKKKKISA